MMRFGLTHLMLLTLIGIASADPTPLLHAFRIRSASVQQSQEGNSESKRVYTNDDFPPAEAPPQSGGQDTDDAASDSEERVAPFVPTPMEIVDKMLEAAKVSSSDVVYDLGSGDGRIVLRAAQRYGARAVGVELDHRLAVESVERAREMRLDKLVTIVEADLFQTDFRPATVVTIYLLPFAYNRLRPLLEKTLRAGARVVVHGFPIPGWDAASERSFNIGFALHTVYLYEIPRAFQRRGTE